MIKTNKITAAAILLALALLAGCGKPAAPIDLPSDDAVAAVGMITMSGEDIYFTDPSRIKAAMDILRAAEDFPVTQVDLQAEAVTSRTHISYIFSIFPVINRQNIKYRRLRRI